MLDKTWRTPVDPRTQKKAEGVYVKRLNQFMQAALLDVTKGRNEIDEFMIEDGKKWMGLLQARITNPLPADKNRPKSELWDNLYIGKPIFARTPELCAKALKAQVKKLATTMDHVYSMLCHE
jgi:hypothetical protein